MAKKIKEEDIVQGDIWQETKKSTTALISLVDDLTKKLSIVAKDTQESLKTADPRDFEGLKKTNAEIDKLNKAFKQKLQLEKQEVLLRNARVKAVDNFTKKEIAAEKKLVKESQKLRKATIDNANAFKQLTKQTNSAQARFKRLAAQYGETDKRTQKALNTFNKLDTKLRSINQTARDGRRDVGRYGTAFSKLGTSIRNIALGLGIVQVIRGIGRAFTDAFSRIRDFDKELQNIAGITGTTRGSLKDLEKSIVEVSSSSIRTSNEVAKLATTLFTLGKTKSEVKLLLKPVNDLSIAFGVSSEQAADFLGQTLSAFGKSARSGLEFADIIANVRTSTALDFERIKDGLGFIAPTANALNLTLGETSALLGVLQNNGVRAARAGRLLNSSFARIIDKGLTLEEALDEINKSQNKVITSSNLFGKEALALGLILADNTEKTAELANEFDNLSDGSLDRLTNKQLKSLDAQLKILDSTWERFILNIENGTGVFSRFTSTTISALTKLIDGFRRLNQSTQENIAEDVEVAASRIQIQVNKTTKIILRNAREQRDKEVSIFKEKLNAKKVSQLDFDQAVERSNKKLANSQLQSTNDAILSQLAVEKNIRQRLLLDNEFTDITINNASKVIEDNKETLIESLSQFKTEFQLNKEKKREEAAKVEIQNVRIEKLKELLAIEKERLELEALKAPVSGASSDETEAPPKELIGLINNQEAAVAKLREQIKEAKIEGGDPSAIKQLGVQLRQEEEELERLIGLTKSNIKEINKIEIDLIENQTQKKIAKEEDRARKLIDNINKFGDLEKKEKVRLIREVEIARDKTIKEFQLKELRDKIKQEAELSRSEIKQRKSGFKTIEKFEKFKAEQFKAIKRNELKALLKVLEDRASAENKAEREKIKGQIAELESLGKEKIKAEVDVIAVLQALNEKYFSDKLDRISEEISQTKKRGDELFQLAATGNEQAAASLAQNQKDQAEAAKKKEDLIQKEKQFELALAVIASYNSELENDKTPSEALASAITSTSVLTSVVAALPSFYEGTTDTGSGGKLDSNGGHLAVLHDNERVVDKKNNAKYGGVSNDDAAAIVHDFNNDLLSYNTPQLTIKESRFDSNEQILTKFDSLEKSIVSAINDKETYLGSDIDTIKKMIIQNYSKAGTRTKVKSKYRTIK